MKKIVSICFLITSTICFGQKDLTYFKSHPEFWPITTSITKNIRVEFLGVVTEVNAGGPYQLIEVEKLLDFVKVYLPNPPSGLKNEYPVEVIYTDFVEQANKYLSSLSEEQKKMNYENLDNYKDQWPDEIKVRRTHKIKSTEKGKTEVAFGDMVKPISMYGEEMIIEINSGQYLIDPTKTDILENVRGENRPPVDLGIDSNISTRNTLIGKDAPNVVSIEADKLFDFTEDGFCKIQRGSKYGYINPKGEYLLKTNHEFIFDGREVTLTISPVAKIGKVAYPNGKFGVSHFDGSIILDGIYDQISIYWNGLIKTNRTISINQYESKTEKDYFDPKGKSLGNIEKIITDNLLNSTFSYEYEMHSVERFYFEDFFKYDLARVVIQGRKNGLDDRMCLVNLKGEIVIPPVYSRLHPFIDDLCAAQIINEYGEKKWGFIDVNNSEVIPFRFTIEPTNFINGLAYVQPSNGELAGFYSAFIDKTGTPVFTISEKAFPPLSSYHFNNRQELVNPETTLSFPILFGPGKEASFTLTENFSKIEFNYNKSFLRIKANQSIPFQDGRTCLYTKRSLNTTSYGFLGLNGKIIMKPIFSKLTNYDAHTGLAKAEITLSNGEKKEGFINDQGQFVIKLKAASGW